MEQSKVPCWFASFSEWVSWRWGIWNELAESLEKRYKDGPLRLDPGCEDA